MIVFGHNYVGHNYMGYNYIGHDYIGCNYTGHNYTGHNYMRHNSIGLKHIDHDCISLRAVHLVDDLDAWQSTAARLRQVATTYVVMACIAMAFVVMAYIVMAVYRRPLSSLVCSPLS